MKERKNVYKCDIFLQDEPSTQALLHMTEVRNAALETSNLDNSNLDTLASLLVTNAEGLVTKEEEYDLGNSQKIDGGAAMDLEVQDTVTKTDHENLETSQFGGQ